MEQFQIHNTIEINSNLFMSVCNRESDSIIHEGMFIFREFGNPVIAALNLTECSNIEQYFNYCLKTGERNSYRNAIKKGSTVRKIFIEERNSRRDELYAINTLKIERQGAAMSEYYQNYPEEDSYFCSCEYHHI